jgi:hypothetical protein
MKGAAGSMTSGPPGSKYLGTETAPSSPGIFRLRRSLLVWSPKSCSVRGTRKLLRSGHTRPGKPASRRPGRLVDGRATPEPNRAEIRTAAQSTCDDRSRSIDQPLNSASFHSVEGMHNIALVEHGEQALDSADRVVLARCDIFRQDATCILHRAQYRFLVGRVQTELLAHKTENSSRGRRIRSSQSGVLTGGPSPAQRVTSAAASLRDKDVPFHGARLQAHVFSDVFADRPRQG